MILGKQLKDKLREKCQEVLGEFISIDWPSPPRICDRHSENCGCVLGNCKQKWQEMAFCIFELFGCPLVRFASFLLFDSCAGGCFRWRERENEVSWTLCSRQNMCSLRSGSRCCRRRLILAAVCSRWAKLLMYVFVSLQEMVWSTSMSSWRLWKIERREFQKMPKWELTSPHSTKTTMGKSQNRQIFVKIFPVRGPHRKQPNSGTHTYLTQRFGFSCLSGLELND